MMNLAISTIGFRSGTGQLLAVSLFLFSFSMNVQAQSADTFTIPKLTGSVTLDGKIDETAWLSLDPLPLTSHWPVFGEPSGNETEIRVAYDEEYLYVSCRCFMDPEMISAPTYKRDALEMNIDHVSVAFDTFNDKENALWFVVTPTGSRFDATVFNDAQGNEPVSTSWDTFWDAESVITEFGWTTEMRIPFSSLRFESNNGRVEMGISIYRYNAFDVSMQTFPAIPPNWGFWSFLKPSQYQPVVFENIENRNPVYFTPYLLGGLQRTAFLDPGANSYSHDRDFTYDAGLDLKMGLTNNATLDITVNTDFAQVEADDEQLNLTRFSLFFPERRQFFLERASIFDFSFGEDNRLFYSRRIGLNDDGQPIRIIAGVRMIARTSGWDVGLLSMQTARAFGNPTENFSTVRFRRQVFNPQSYAGGMITGRFAENGSYNAAFGLDGIFKLYGNDFLNINLANTADSDLESSFFHHQTFRFRSVMERRTFSGLSYNLSYNYSGRSYDPGMGFQLRNNYMSFGDRISYGWQPADAPIQRVQTSLNGSLFLRNDDHSLETLMFGPSVEFTWRRGDFATARFQWVEEDILQEFSLSDDVFIPAGRYSYPESEIEYHTPRGRSLRAVLTAAGGRFFDGRRFTTSVNPQWSPSRLVQFDLFYQLNRVTFDKRSQDLLAHIARLRTEFTFNTKTTFSTFVQYNSNFDLGVINVRFRYNPKDGNNFYLVFNETINANRSRTSPPLPASDNRMVLLKYNYTFGF
jgi:hypothetical protein